MSRFYYFLARKAGRLIGFQTMQIKVLHQDRFNQSGGFILACTHLSHLEPFIVSGLMGRKIDWMARIEFYKYRVIAMLLRAFDCFPVNRQGVPVKAIRSAIHRTKSNRVIGIFPEGGVAHGRDSVLLGGPIKLGACVIALRAGVPIIPVAVLGTAQLNRVTPWIPWRRVKLWLILGRPIQPAAQYPSRRAARLEMGERLQQEFQVIYKELCQTRGIPEGEGVYLPHS